MAATLTTEASDAKKVVAAVEECRRMGIAVLAPDINASDAGCTVERAPIDADQAVDATDAASAADVAASERWGVRFGLMAVKNVGSAVHRRVARSAARRRAVHVAGGRLRAH